MVNNNPKRKTNKVNKIKLPFNTEIKALIYNNNYKEPDCVTIKKYIVDFFHHKGRSYKIDFQDVMFFKRKKLLFGGILYLFYHYDNDQPLRVDDELRAISQKRIPNEVIYTALKSDAIKKANDIKSGGFIEENLTLIMVLGAVAIAVYFMFGG